MGYASYINFYFIYEFTKKLLFYIHTHAAHTQIVIYAVGYLKAHRVIKQMFRAVLSTHPINQD